MTVFEALPTIKCLDELRGFLDEGKRQGYDYSDGEIHAIARRRAEIQKGKLK